MTNAITADGSPTRLVEGVAAATSAVAWTAAAAERLNACEEDVRAWVALRESEAAADAAERDARPERGPLHGVPVGVKDIIDIAGMPTRCGSGITAETAVTASAACITRLEELGAVMLGKTVTTEFAYFAPGPTRNPRNLDHTPGGSSSGSAAAVAAGVVPLAMGSQTAGSLTRPAAFCGIAGMVLAQGTVDLSGVVGLSESLDSLGILTADVADLMHVYEAFTGDELSVTDAIDVRLWHGSGLGPVEPAMAAAVRTAGELLTAAGAKVVDLDWDDHVETLVDDHQTIMSFEAAQSRPDLLAHLDQLSQPLVELLEAGRSVAEADYRNSLIRRDISRGDLTEVLRDGAVIVGPAATGAAPHGLGATGTPILSRPWQALGLAVVTVPGARDEHGMPLGLQVIGSPGRESEIFATARLLEAELASHQPSL